MLTLLLACGAEPGADAAAHQGSPRRSAQGALTLVLQASISLIFQG
ncbi:MAG: hypothetical protein ACK55Z_25430 [bacterium]